MKTIDRPTLNDSSSSVSVFFLGFFIRLLYGSLALPFLALIRPDLFGEKYMAMVFAVSFFLLVCLAGGAYDVATRQTREIRLFQKPRLVDIVIFAAMVVALLLNR